MSPERLKPNRRNVKVELSRLAERMAREFNRTLDAVQTPEYQEMEGGYLQLQVDEKEMLRSTEPIYRDRFTTG